MFFKTVHFEASIHVCVGMTPCMRACNMCHIDDVFAGNVHFSNLAMMSCKAKGVFVVIILTEIYNKQTNQHMTDEILVLPDLKKLITHKDPMDHYYGRDLQEELFITARYSKNR